MQNSLFGESEDDLCQAIKPVTPTADLMTLAQTLPSNVRLGTSSWSCSGWRGLVWDREHPDTHLSNYGLNAYNKHPLFRTVCIDHGFYQPVTAEQFAQYASQVNDDFRFMVKAPKVITDALIRDQSGRGMLANPTFLNVADAMQLFVEPALKGLGHKIGALVFQFSPLPDLCLKNMPALIKRLQRFLEAIPDIRHVAPDGVVAVEVRNHEWLKPELGFAQALKSAKATYCLGLHAKMPFITEQLDVLRHLFPGPLVCRWNLNPVHGDYGYEDAGEVYSPYNKIIDPDIKTRAELARVISGIAKRGQKVYVAISNKAEGSAPLSVIELAKAVHQR